MTASITTNELTTDEQLVPPPHPGKVLNEEFLAPLGITQYRLAQELHTSKSQISKLVRGSIGLSADMALRLSTFFGNSPQFWLGIQNTYDLWNAEISFDRGNITVWDQYSA